MHYPKEGKVFIKENYGYLQEPADQVNKTNSPPPTTTPPIDKKYPHQ